MRGVTLRGGERGATIAIVALSMAWILGVGSLVLDVGNAQRIRRSIVPAADAAALAAAQDFVNGSDGCAASAPTYVTSNEAGAVLESCTPLLHSAQRGRVTVTVTHNVDTVFASFLGRGDFTVSATSSAAWAPPATLRGVRPLTICLDASPEFRNVFFNPPAVDETVTLTWAHNPSCGSGSSNVGPWGVLDFDNGSPYSDQAKVENWLLNGFAGDVSYGSVGASTCDGSGPTGGPDCVDGAEASNAFYNNGWTDELDYLKDNDIFIGIPVYDHVDDNSLPDEFHIVGVIRARILDFYLGGPGGDDDDDDDDGDDEDTFFITLDVQPGLVGGTCCGDGSGAAGNQIVAVCGVDPGPTALAACDP